MGWRDRPYAQRDYDDGSRGVGAGLGGMTIGMPKPSPAVKVLLVINIAVFVVQIFLDKSEAWRPGPMSRYLGVTVGGFWQIWRYITFQFLHAGWWHILLNMLGLYILGSPVEGHFGTRKFVWFYLSCGVVGGLAYVVIGALGNLPAEMPIIGASGGVYGIILACAVFFPTFKIIFLFFPVPIRFASLIIFGGMILLVMRKLSEGDTGAAMSAVAHLGGAVAAAVWIWGLPKLKAGRSRGAAGAGQGRWEKKLARQRELQQQVDAILDKIRREGIGSLSRREKRTLKQASEEQQGEAL